MIEIPEVNDLEVALSCAADRVLPARKTIPAEFWKDGNRWHKVASDWFFFGLAKSTWKPKPGVDKNKALRAITATLGDFGPEHNHKIAGCAYLLSEWFEDVTYTRGKPS